MAERSQVVTVSREQDANINSFLQEPLSVDDLFQIEQLVWPSRDTNDAELSRIQMLWFEDGFEFVECSYRDAQGADAAFRLGFNQLKNGTCGVLAAVLAVLLKFHLFDGKVRPWRRCPPGQVSRN